MGRRLCPHSGSPLASLSGPLEMFDISPDGVVYSRDARAVVYGEDYFLSEYKAQYGRSYLEDEPALRGLAKSRLEFLRAACPPPATLLEIGCATGFFLDEARHAGYEVVGVEVSPFASDYARNELALDVRCGSFPEVAPDKDFDCVAAFYVLEHFSDQGALFGSLKERLRPGGTLLGALPSTNGPLFTTDPEAWARSHPVDHFADYSPAALIATLPRYGMKFLRARPASYHPARMRRQPFWKWFPALYRWWADRKAFGDTMEFLARRDEQT